MALGSIQSLIEMNTRNILAGGKGCQCLGLTTLPPSCADCLESGSLNLVACLGLYRDRFTFTFP